MYLFWINDFARDIIQIHERKKFGKDLVELYLGIENFGLIVESYESFL